MTSAAGTGEVPVDPRNTPALTVGNFGSVDIKGGSKLDVGNPGVLGAGGSVFIHAGALTIDASEIGADNYGSGPGGVIALRGETQVALSNGTSVHAAALGSGGGAGISIATAPAGAISADASLVLTSSTGPGSAGPLAASTGQLTLTNGAELASITQGTGNGGPVAVNANTVVVDGTANPTALTAIGSVTTGRGTASDVAVSAGTLTILANGEIVSFTAGPGNAGNVSLSAPGAVSIDGTSTVFQAGILSQANPGSSGNAGSVQVNAGSLSLVNCRPDFRVDDRFGGGRRRQRPSRRQPLDKRRRVFVDDDRDPRHDIPPRRKERRQHNCHRRRFVDRHQRGDRQRHIRIWKFREMSRSASPGHCRSTAPRQPN